MLSIDERNRESELPHEIRSADRQVRLKFSGAVVLMIVAAVLAAAVWLPVMLYAQVKQDEHRLVQFSTEAVTTEAEVIHIRRGGDDNGRVRLTYRYNAGGLEYRTQTSVARREAPRFPVGAHVPVRYLPSDPRQSWLEGQRPGSTPDWLVFLVPPALVVVAGVLLLPIRKQTRLLAEGRAAVARVMGVQKVKGEHGSTWRVSYEWRLLSGATRKSRYDSTKKVPPAIGSTFPVLYDRDNPQRHARYPLSLVRLAGAPHRAARRTRGNRKRLA